MNSEYLFLTGKGHLPKKAAQIAKRHGATLVNYTDPQCSCGHGCSAHQCRSSRRHWFAAANLGSPHDSRRRDVIAAELAA